MYSCLSFTYVNSVMTCFKAQGQFLHAMLNLCLEYFMSRTIEDNGLKLLPFESWIVCFTIKLAYFLMKKRCTLFDEMCYNKQIQ